MSREVIVLAETDEAGNVRLSVQGCVGPECASLTKSLEAALGDVIEDTKLPEFYQESLQQEKVKARQ